MFRRLAATASLLLAAAPACGRDVTHTNRAGFSIPFAADPAELAAAGAGRAKLLVSVDGGARWEEAAAASPGDATFAAGRFRFEAPADGDYWFTVLTVDAAGRPAPADAPLEAQLHVRVDRAAPPVTVDAEPLGDGTVSVRWAVADAAADVRTLAVSFAPDGGEFQAVPVAAAPAGSFRMPADRANGTVRVSVQDPAGNVGEATRRIGGTAAPPPAVPLPAAAAAPPPLPVPAAGSHPSLLPVAARRAAGGPPFKMPASAAGPAPDPVLRDRRFKVGYAVDAVGSSGVGSVELFITPDGGAHWYSYGTDPDRRSPAEVEVPGDGEYGFTVRVRSGAGLAAKPPKPGDRPDVRVAVDSTPPAVELLSAAQGRGADANTLSVVYRVRDDRPADRPVRIELAASAAGPWDVVRDWSADAGAAALPLRAGAPARVFVRVTARDAAGNERSVVTPDGVAVDLAEPAARVIGVVR